MEIIQVPTNQLKPDPNQPRKLFDPIRIKGLAQAIVTEGVINPIEIDKNNMIVTGELRWRASKEAGLKTVPCKVIEIDQDERLRRQMIENIHHNTMNALDTALGLNKLLERENDVYTVNIIHPKTHKGDYQPDQGMRRLSLKLGVSPGYISQYLSLLKEKLEVQEWLRGGGSKSLVLELKRFKTPPETQEAIKDKIIKGEIKHARTVRELGRAIIAEPEKSEVLLAQTYSEGSETANLKKVHEIVPEEPEKPEEYVKGSKLWVLFYKVISMLNNTNPNDILPEDRQRIVAHKDKMIKAINRFENLQAEEAVLVEGDEVKQLE
jgi:hypothetical protein